MNWKMKVFVTRLPSSSSSLLPSYQSSHQPPPIVACAVVMCTPSRDANPCAQRKILISIEILCLSECSSLPILRYSPIFEPIPPTAVPWVITAGDHPLRCGKQALSSDHLHTCSCPRGPVSCNTSWNDRLSFPRKGKDSAASLVGSDGTEPKPSE
jgi:hypothetical protein